MTTICVDTGLNTIFQFAKPLLIFNALLDDSNFWKGISGSEHSCQCQQGVIIGLTEFAPPPPIGALNTPAAGTDIRAPLMGVHITSRAAGLLARDLEGLPFLSHAFLSLVRP